MKLDELRRDFDGTFALPAEQAAEGRLAFLIARVGGEGVAIPVHQLDGLSKGRRVVRVPDAPTGVRGLAGVRGRLVTVFSLAAMLGHSEEAEEGWLLLAGGEEPVGLALGILEGQIRAVAADILPLPAGTRSSAHVREYLRGGDGTLRGIVDVAGLVEHLRTSPGGRPLKEP